MTRKRKRKHEPDDETLVPLPELEVAMRKVLRNTKEESDKQLQEFQATNKHPPTPRQSGSQRI